MKRLCLVLLLVGTACSPRSQTELSPLAQQGKRVYENVCIACHHGDPNRDGAIGPANAGASEALLRAKVVHGGYPPGYTPKRTDSNAMPRFPQLEEEIPALAAYLAAVEQDAPAPER